MTIDRVFRRRVVHGGGPAPAVCGLLVAGACSLQDLGLPRVAVSSWSPDGRYRAFVRNHPSIDPPAQSLWLASATGAATLIRKLSEDQDWCRVIAWAGDSRSVAFLVQDARLIVVDAATRRTRVDRWLVEQDGYPPTQLVIDLSVSQDGSSVRFKACRRATGACANRVETLGPPLTSRAHWFARQRRGDIGPQGLAHGQVTGSPGSR